MMEQFVLEAHMFISDILFSTICFVDSEWPQQTQICLALVWHEPLSESNRPLNHPSSHPQQNSLVCFSGVWTHIVVTWTDVDGVTVYLNGQNVYSLTDYEDRSVTSTSDNNIYIGEYTVQFISDISHEPLQYLVVQKYTYLPGYCQGQPFSK